MENCWTNGVKGKDGKDKDDFKGKEEKMEKEKRRESQNLLLLFPWRWLQQRSEVSKVSQNIKAREGKCYVCRSTKQLAAECDRAKKDLSQIANLNAF